MSEIREKLDSILSKKLTELDETNMTPEERNDLLNDIESLHDMRIEEIKANTESVDKAKQRLFEEESRKDQNKDIRIDRYVKIGVIAAELIIPIMFYSAYMDRGFKFEEKGVYTSKTFMGLINRFRPTK